MKAKIANFTPPNIPGNVDLSSNPETVTAMLKEWRQRFGYYSMFAAVPAILASHVPAAHSDQAKKPAVSVAEQGARLPATLNIIGTNPALLKRQSAFLLPHQKGGFNMLTMVAGNDDCPGRIIPGGNYTAAAPYIDSGDTTGANDTVTQIPSFYYYYFYTYSTHGPDHVYTFTLTGRGPNPQIEVSTTSGTYKPLIYILEDGMQSACPSGTGNTGHNELVMAFPSAGTATLNRDQINFLPLNVPLHLFVDSDRNDTTGSGPYTIRMQDVTVAPAAACGGSNQIDCTEFFVRQHYLDFLNRDPDASGQSFWNNEITSCFGNVQCIEVRRLHVSAAFFLSIEFQETGYLVYKTYAAAFGATRIGSTVPLTRSEFLPDLQRLGQGVVVGKAGWQAQIEANQAAYFNEFVARPAFVASYPATMTNTQFLDALIANAGHVLSLPKRDQLLADLTSGAKTRAQVLRAVVEDEDFTLAQFNRAFVLMQYFGYLRRNPNDAPDNGFGGYNFWVTKLDQFAGDFIDAEMVKAFITSNEYRQRFGKP